MMIYIHSMENTSGDRMSASLGSPSVPWSRTEGSWLCKKDVKTTCP